ncbi:MAG: FkbM family methyltransferase [Alphaproteobacteria bacterium]|nr:FkbM family methyltransferase [Alphaproteobacteria bacterium]
MGGGGDLRETMALLKALWKLRPPGEPEPPGARLVRRWREKRLLARLERDWPGGFTLHRTGDLVFVPHPLDARGRHALLHPPRAHPAALAALRPGSVAIDIGASLGEWTVPLARAVGPMGRVLAVEPAPRNAAALRETLAANALHQAQLADCAIGDHDGCAEFAVPVVASARTDTGTARIGAPATGHQRLSVRLRTLDSLVGEQGLDRIDLIKIDVEGHERKVLDGAAATIERCRPTLVIETGHEAEGDRVVLCDRLCGLGYRLLGILLDYGMAAADWDAYVAVTPPFRRGDAHNLLLVAK